MFSSSANRDEVGMFATMTLLILIHSPELARSVVRPDELPNKVERADVAPTEASQFSADARPGLVPIRLTLNDSAEPSPAPNLVLESSPDAVVQSGEQSEADSDTDVASPVPCASIANERTVGRNSDSPTMERKNSPLNMRWRAAMPIPSRQGGVAASR